MLTIAICDDEKPIIEKIKETVIDTMKERDNEYQIVEFKSGEEVIEYTSTGENEICTVKSNLMERRKEIFTMRALGMSLKDMNRMNMYESVTYAVLSIAVGIAISTYKLIEFVNWNNDAYKNFGIEHFMDFTFPYKEAIVFALVTLITCIVSVKLANRNFRNKEISDGMRDVE